MDLRPKRYRLPPGMELFLRDDRDTVQATFTLETVDSYRPDAPTKIVSQRRIQKLNQEYVDQGVIAEARSLWMHEFNEWMMVDGELVHDPHAK